MRRPFVAPRSTSPLALCVVRVHPDLPGSHRGNFRQDTSVPIWMEIGLSARDGAARGGERRVCRSGERRSGTRAQRAPDVSRRHRRGHVVRQRRRSSSHAGSLRSPRGADLEIGAPAGRRSDRMTLLGRAAGAPISRSARERSEHPTFPAVNGDPATSPANGGGARPTQVRRAHREVPLGRAALRQFGGSGRMDTYGRAAGAPISRSARERSEHPTSPAATVRQPSRSWRIP